jgi:hypothetical protein
MVFMLITFTADTTTRVWEQWVTDEPLGEGNSVVCNLMMRKTIKRVRRNFERLQVALSSTLKFTRESRLLLHHTGASSGGCIL